MGETITKLTKTMPSYEAHSLQVTVKSGDTLSGIAADNGVPMGTIRSANPDLVCSDQMTTADGFCMDDAGNKRTTGGDLIYKGDTVVVPTIFKESIFLLESTRISVFPENFEYKKAPLPLGESLRQMTPEEKTKALLDSMTQKELIERMMIQQQDAMTGPITAALNYLTGE